ncbi:MAG: type II toxin-antitoxin system HicB family antitoxin [Cyanobacterium sp. T60_A2020_053]|nr:type II toxin-antitoxin system HicB family antitoxin [Cyanobacterium sp. T60_A2020_053]
MKTQIFTVVIHKEEDMYIAECLDVGTIDQGSTIEEAINNLREATRLYLEECPDVEAIPKLVTTMEVGYGELVYA